ncbi:hypothetical protein GmHk_18G050777 [Glycine max]|nr:hypothetical protein GmHk_18G050777 [Glycine max]
MQAIRRNASLDMSRSFLEILQLSQFPTKHIKETEIGVSKYEKKALKHLEHYRQWDRRKGRSLPHLHNDQRIRIQNVERYEMFINRSPLPLEIYHCMTEYQIRAEDENQCCITEQQLSNPNTFKSWLSFPPMLPLINYLNGFQYFKGLVFGSLTGVPWAVICGKGKGHLREKWRDRQADRMPKWTEI